jgi:hypothetical protein
VRERVTSGRTGAAWQRAAVSGLEGRMGRSEAVRAMLGAYRRNAAGGEPVHLWDRVRG